MGNMLFNVVRQPVKHVLWRIFAEAAVRAGGAALGNVAVHEGANAIKRMTGSNRPDKNGGN